MSVGIPDVTVGDFRLLKGVLTVLRTVMGLCGRGSRFKAGYLGG